MWFQIQNVWVRRSKLLFFCWFDTKKCDHFLETDKAIFEEILHGKLDLQSDPWPSISAGAKDLISKMLTRNPKNRITADKALG